MSPTPTLNIYLFEGPIFCNKYFVMLLIHKENINGPNTVPGGKPHIFFYIVSGVHLSSKLALKSRL
jgi:hypothetical protein